MRRTEDTYYRPPIRLGEGFLAGVMLGVIIGAIIFYETKSMHPVLPIPAGFPVFHVLLSYLASLVGYSLTISGNTTWASVAYSDPAWASAFVLHLTWSAIVGLIVAIVVGVLTGRPRPYERHIRGRQLVKDKDAQRKAQAAEKSDIKRTGAGIQIHPGITISEDRERRSFAIVGSPGGGKTTIILPLVVQCIERNDKVIIYDNKPSYTEYVPGDIVLIAPWDKRGIPWAIWRDCVSLADAQELSARLVLESHDPMWSNAARMVLTGLIVHLQKQGKPWGWQDLSVLVNLPVEELQEIILPAYPAAWRSIEVASRTTQSILITLSAYLAQVHQLAAVWGNAEDGFSITEFLADDYQGVKTLILQGNRRYNDMQVAIVNGIMALAAAYINSPAMTDSTERKVWLYLDEAPQLRKAEWIADIVAVGRSKGVRVLLGVQDVAQLRQIYGRDQTESWTSMIGTYVFTMIGGNDTAKWVSDFVAEREIERYETTFTDPQRVGTNRQRSESYRRQTEKVIRPDELQTLLGPHKQGVRALLHMGNLWECLLTWPYSYLMIPTVRPASMLADWTTRPQATIENEGDGLADAMEPDHLADLQDVSEGETLPEPEPEESSQADDQKNKKLLLKPKKAAHKKADKLKESKQVDLGLDEALEP